MENKITFEEHKQVGYWLKLVSYKMIKSTTLKKKADEREKKILKLTNQLRNELEEIMFRDYGIWADEKFKNNWWWQDIYYGTAMFEENMEKKEVRNEIQNSNHRQ
jgi:hypothetical protein